VAVVVAEQPEGGVADPDRAFCGGDGGRVGRRRGAGFGGEGRVGADHDAKPVVAGDVRDRDDKRVGRGEANDRRHPFRLGGWIVDGRGEQHMVVARHLAEAAAADDRPSGRLQLRRRDLADRRRLRRPRR
jgi:hypothetical protein